MKIDSSNVQTNFTTPTNKPKAEASPVTVQNNDNELAEKKQRINDSEEKEKKVQQNNNSVPEKGRVDISI